MGIINLIKTNFTNNKMKFLTIAALIAVAAANDDEIPDSGKSDLAKDAQAKAAEAIGKYEGLQDTEQKAKDKYDDMSADDKAAYDKKLKAKQEAREKRDADERTAAGYKDMTTAQ